jgi:hypothetical protein
MSSLSPQESFNMKYQLFVYMGVSGNMTGTACGHHGDVGLDFDECSRKELRSVLKEAVCSGDPTVEVHVRDVGKVFMGSAFEALTEFKPPWLRTRGLPPGCPRFTSVRT